MLYLNESHKFYSISLISFYLAAFLKSFLKLSWSTINTITLDCIQLTVWNNFYIYLVSREKLPSLIKVILSPFLMYIHLIVLALVLLLEEFLQPINKESTSYLQSTSNIIKYCTVPWIFPSHLLFTRTRNTTFSSIYFSKLCGRWETQKSLPHTGSTLMEYGEYFNVCTYLLSAKIT